MKFTLAEINDNFNRRIRSVEEPPGEDDWQTPAETIMRLTGDCEDFAIAKLYAMVWAGYREEDISIHCVRLKGEYHNYPAGTIINHAFLVYQGWVLDNYVKEIVALKDRIDVKETYAIINTATPNKYKQWNNMLSRRDKQLDETLIANLFGQD